MVIDGWPKYPHRKIVGEAVAKELGFHSMDGSLFFRAVASLVYLYRTLNPDRIICMISKGLLRFEGEAIFVDTVQLNGLLYNPVVMNMARIVEQVEDLRKAITPLILAQRKLPGLVVWGGRDLGKIYDTSHKFFLDTEATTKLEKRERNRMVSPLVPSQGAWVIDVGHDPDTVIKAILSHCPKGMSQ